MNHSRCWAKERASVPSLATGTRGGTGAARTLRRASSMRPAMPATVGMREQLAQRQFDLKRAAYAGRDAGGEQRMPPELEEVVVNPDTLQPEDLGPDAGDDFLRVSARGRRSALRPGRVVHRGRQCPEVDLAVGSQRQRVQPDEVRRDHVVGQLGSKEVAQLRRRRLASLSPNDVRDQLPVASPVVACHDERIAHGRVGAKHRGHLRRLDAKAANLDLLIGATEQLDAPVGAIPDDVTRPVQTCARLVAEGVGDEDSRR